MKRIGILTSGGDCSGLNAVIESVVRTAELNGMEVLGYKMGYDGLLNNDFVILHKDDVFDLSKKGGSVLGNSNKTNLFHLRKVDKNGNVSYEDVSDIAIKNMKDEKVEALIVVGGDGSMTSARDFMRKGVNVVCIPKTIDNDVPYTDKSFGYTTAYFHIADAIQSVRTTAKSHDRIIVVEAMGRHTGWLALEGGIGGNADAILIPELNFDMDKLVNFLIKRYNEGYRSSIICVAEGAHPKGGDIVSQTNNAYPDSMKLGGVSLILAKEIEDRVSPITHQEVRACNISYIQRGGDTNIVDIVLGYRYGTQAVNAIINNEFGVMVSVIGDKETLVPIVNIVGDGPMGETSTGGSKYVVADSDLLKTARFIGIYLGDD